MKQLDERVINMYKSIRDILMKYRSGKLPKAFKIVPALSNWEQVSVTFPVWSLISPVIDSEHLTFGLLIHV